MNQKDVWMISPRRLFNSADIQHKEQKNTFSYTSTSFLSNNVFLSETSVFSSNVTNFVVDLSLIDMKKRLAHFLFLMLMLSLMPFQKTEARNEGTMHHETQALAEHNRHGIIQTVMHDVFCLCNSRPQRVIPTGGRGHVNSAKLPFQKGLRTFKKNFAGKITQYQTVIILPYAPCDYYVIALRRMLC